MIVKPGKPAVARSRGVALRSAARTGERYSTLFVRQLADQAFSRASGAPLREGNRVRILRNADRELSGVARGDQRRPALDPLRDVHHPRRRSGTAVRRRADRKAAEGVAVRLLYDWMGGFGKTSRGFWNRLARRRRRGPLLQPAPVRSPARMGQPRSPQDDRRRRRRRVRDGLVRRPDLGRAIPRAGSIPGATPGSRCAGRRSPTSSRRSPKPGRPPATPLPDATRTPRRRIAHAGRRAAARRRDRAEHGRTVPRRSARCGDGPPTRCG